MGTFEDYDFFVLMEDWTNPLLDGYFPSVMNDIEPIFADRTDENPANVELGGASNSNAMAEPQGSNRGSLRERIAAKGNFNTLTLNTEDLSKNPEEKGGPYLTIPPGFSPTFLLDSPVFLSNPLVLPSPTTGKLPDSANGNNANSAILIDDDIDNGKEISSPDANTSSFSNKPVAESSACPYFYSVNKALPLPTTGKLLDSSYGNNADSAILIDDDIGNGKENTFPDANTSSFSYKPVAESSECPYFYSVNKALPSPTTGKLPDYPNGNNANSAILIDDDDDNDNGKEISFPDANTSSFSYKPVAESSACPYFYEVNKVNPLSFASQSCSNAKQNNFCSDANNSDNVLLQFVEPSNIYLQNNAKLFNQKTFTNTVNSLSTAQTYNPFGVQEPPPRNELEVNDGRRRITEYPNVNGGPPIHRDGYNWKKYGQKPVKGSMFPRSYFKCTQQNCPVKKKVERSIEGHITDVIYNGEHNHPNPSNHRFHLNSLNPLDETQLEQSKTSADNAFDWSSMLEKLEENNFSAFGDASGVRYESLDQSANLSNDEDDDLVTHGSSSTGCDGEGDESDSKRRKTEPYGDGGGSSKAPRETRIIIQTTSEIDILEDGYRWRKYGQKIVKGNHNPRSYYKCTTPSCNVRKHVERSSHDLNSVLTTYEGRHNHEVPEARNLGQYPAQQGIFHMYELNRLNQLRQGRSRHGSGPPAYVYGMSQQDDLGMDGLGHEDTTGQQASMAPPRMDSVSDSGLNDSDASEAINQLMSQMPPPGPQM